jgi:hypothetical protein
MLPAMTKKRAVIIVAENGAENHNRIRAAITEIKRFTKKMPM